MSVYICMHRFFIMILRFFYWIYMFLVAIPLFLVATLLAALFTVGGCLLGFERTFSYYPGMLWSRLTCFLSLCPVSVRGLEHIKKGESYVFVSNHQGAFDIFLIYGRLGVPFKWVMKSGIQRIPFVGRACSSAGFVFVDSRTAKSALRSVQESEACIKRGFSVVIFPEASRTYDGKMIRFKKGAFQIAVDSGVKVVPITLNGPYDVLPIGSLNVRPHRMEMVVHPPISVDSIENNPKNLQALADQTQQCVATALWECYK